jgi:hypothetical protein
MDILKDVYRCAERHLLRRLVMNSKNCALVMIAALVLSQPASLMADSVAITSIFGSGVSDTGWWDAGANSSTMQIAMRARDTTTDATTNNGNGTYYMPVGHGSSSNIPLWNFELSIFTDPLGLNPGSTVLSSFYILSIDKNPASGQQSWTTFGLIWGPSSSIIPPYPYSEWSVGNIDTPNGGGTEDGTFSAHSKAQLSTSMNFPMAPWGNGDPDIDATYDFILRAYSYPVGDESVYQEVRMRVVVGNGGPLSIPDTGTTLGMIGAAFLGLGLIRRKFAA